MWLIFQHWASFSTTDSGESVEPVQLWTEEKPFSLCQGGIEKENNIKRLLSEHIYFGLQKKKKKYWRKFRFFLSILMDLCCYGFKTLLYIFSHG